MTTRRILTLAERVAIQCEGVWEQLMARLTPATRRAFDDREVVRARADVPETSLWHLIIAAVDDSPVLQHFSSYEALLEAAKTLVKEVKNGSGYHFYAFYGRVFKLSDPETWPLVYLEGPDNQYHPLYDVPSKMKASVDGYIGPPRPPEIRSLTLEEENDQVRAEPSDAEENEDEEGDDGEEEEAADEDGEITEDTE
jgi:hypothetical protein